MDTTMQIMLGFSETAFNATARITLDDALNEKLFSFCLNDALTISEIAVNGKPVNYEMAGKEQPQFRPLVKKISVASEETIRNIEISYNGSVAYSPKDRACFHNIITKDIKSLSWYSSWYPQDASVGIVHDKVVLLEGSRYVVVKGTYDAARDVWEYGGNGYDRFNIVAYRKAALQVISNPYMNIYFIDDGIREYAEASTSSYQNVVSFYNGNLFAKRDIPVLDVACASPAITTGGGYRRKDFMWCTTLGNNKEEAAWLNAHETAHIWCSGAPADTWEDWLNETTAEWASLLFALDSGDDALFKYILEPKLAKYDSLPPIQTADGSRPEGVHDKGTVLFYEMYKLFGVDAVRKVVRLFTDLDTKTTASLIHFLRTENNNDIADFIEEGIVK